MKIRTITTGVALQSPNDEAKIRQAAEFNDKSKVFFEKAGYEVRKESIAIIPFSQAEARTVEEISSALRNQGANVVVALHLK